MVIDLSKQQALDANPKAIQQINFTGNLSGNNDSNNDRNNIFHYWGSERHNFKFFTRNC